ncbi:MAG: hypothetical protein ABF429_06210 [Zymomonas mobilis]|nr:MULTISPECIES: hypothetical protein [Zymomonas]MCA1955705.1 hypothetical protein [Zymomonas sp.]UBQ07666.1 hypothetical protein LB319_08640 [Zymomonas mobilis]
MHRLIAMALAAGVVVTGCSDHHKKADQNQADHHTPLTPTEMEQTEPLSNTVPAGPDIGPLSSAPAPEKPVSMPDDGTKAMTKKLPKDKVIDRESVDLPKQGYGKTSKDSQIMSDAMATGMTTPMTAHIKDGDRPGEPSVNAQYDNQYHKSVKELSPSNVLEPENKEKKEVEEKEQEKKQLETQAAESKKSAAIAESIARGARGK